MNRLRCVDTWRLKANRFVLRPEACASTAFATALAGTDSALKSRWDTGIEDEDSLDRV